MQKNITHLVQMLPASEHTSEEGSAHLGLFDTRPHVIIRQAADAVERLTPEDLLKLKYYAQMRTLGRCGGASWEDLLQDSIMSLLNGRRRIRPGVPFVALLIGAMRSISSKWYARNRTPEVAVEDVLDKTADRLTPESIVSAKSEVAWICSLFVDDPVALQIIEGWGEGQSGPEIQESFGITDADFAAAVRRIRRTLIAKKLRAESQIG